MTEVGATLRTFEVGGMPVLDGFSDEEWSPSGRGQVLAPWPNRLDAGTYELGGVRGQAPIDEPARGNAIHGLVRWMAWQLEAHAQNRVSLTCELHPMPAYPFGLHLRVEYRLGRDGLTVVTTASNVAGEVLPFGLGFHPYLTAGTGLVDSALLRVPAQDRLVLDERGLPTGDRVPVAGTPFDFLVDRPIGGARLDTAYGALVREPDGTAVARLSASSGDRTVELWVDESFRYLMCFTGDTVGDEARRRYGLAVEPMTCPPNALRTGRDLIVLEPGQHWEGSWGLRVR